MQLHVRLLHITAIIALSLTLLLGTTLPSQTQSIVAAGQPATITEQLWLPVVASAVNGEAQQEFGFLQGYVAAYKVSETQLTAFNQWRQNAWASPPVDTAYYRAVCNTAAVAALVKQEEPTNPNVDLSRAAAMLMAVIREYDDNPYSASGPEARDGWGFPVANDDATLNFDTPFVGYPCAVAAALLWPQLTSTEHTQVRVMLDSFAERLRQYRDVSFFISNAAHFNCGNSPAEEVAAYASFLATMSQFHRTHPQAIAWRTTAQGLMDYAFNHATTDSLNLRPGCSIPMGGSSFTNTVTNHRVYPHAVYGFSVLNEISRALLPWSAQGITLINNPVTNISSLDASLGNDKLYGTGFAASSATALYFANMAYLNGANSTGAVTTTDFTLRGNVYDALNINDVIDFQQKSYLGRAGVSDWGFGLDFQNGAHAWMAWIDMTVNPTLGNFYYNYGQLITYQLAQGASKGYFPGVHANSCAGPVQNSAVGWQVSYLPETCNARLNGILVPFYDGYTTFQLANQVNTHLFLNSFSAFNHLVAYFYMRPAFWPPDSNGISTLPDFGF